MVGQNVNLVGPKKKTKKNQPHTHILKKLESLGEHKYYCMQLYVLGLQVKCIYYCGSQVKFMKC